MSVYYIDTTQNISANAPSGVVAGDYIYTQGYYTVGDGGAAKFVVQSGTASGYFQHQITTGLKAVLVIENGTVNVDQLGAKPMAGTYLTFEEYLTQELISSPTLTNVYAYSQYVAGFLENDTSNPLNNGNLIHEATMKSSVHEVRFSGGKLYGVAYKQNGRYTNPIPIDRSNITLNGCGATVQGLFDNRTQFAVVRIFSGKSNITIENLHIRSLFLGESSHCIRNESTTNLTVRNVDMENAYYGVRVSGEDVNSNVVLEKLHIAKVMTGVQLVDVTGGHFLDSYVSCDWNNINTTNEPSGKHCIYASGAISNYRFSRLTLLNAGGGNAINRNDNGSNPGVSDNLIFSDIIIDNCRKALEIGHLTHNSVIRNVFATNIKKHGMDLNGIQNVTFTNCHFSGATENTYDAGFLIPSDYDYSASLENTYVRNVLIKDCTFTFKTSFLEIGLSRYRNCSGIRVENCSFKISNPAFDVEESLYPAYIKGIIQDIQFFGCRFETDGFYSVDHSRNGIFFYFDSGLSTSNVREMHWSFEKCAFINNGSVTVNSPILSRSSNDSTNSVYCTLVKCTFKGFRWLIRVATTKDEPTNANQRYYRKPGKINPYFYEDPTVDPPTPGMTEEEIVQNAVEALNNLKRFVSYKNLYLEPDSSGIIHYRNAETYGVQG